MIHIVDVETTGVDPAADRVVEFAAVPVRIEGDASAPGARLVIEPGVSSLVYPGIPIPPQASAVHHLIDADVEDAPPLGRAINHVLGPLWQADPDAIFAAHNARFDRGFLHPLHGAKWVCTYRCSLHVWPDAPTHSNQGLRYFLGLRVPRDLPTHRALGDATVTAHLFARLLEERSLDDLVKLSTKAVVLRKVRFGKHAGADWSAVPTDYLEWLANQKSDDPDVRFTVKFELARRMNAKEQTL